MPEVCALLAVLVIHARGPKFTPEYSKRQRQVRVFKSKMAGTAQRVAYAPSRDCC